MLHAARDRRRSGRLTGLMLLLSLAVVAMGCPSSYEPDERSTADKARTGARAVPMRTAVTDAINYEGGDATDWKSFEAPGAGPITIEVFFDNSFVRAEVGLYDSYGTQLARQARTGGSDPTRIVHEMPGTGLFFIMIHATENRSVYSIRIRPGAADSGAPQQVVDPQPEFDRPI